MSLLMCRHCGDQFDTDRGGCVDWEACEPCTRQLDDEDRTERGGERDPDPYDPYELEEDEANA